MLNGNSSGFAIYVVFVSTFLFCKRLPVFTHFLLLK